MRAAALIAALAFAALSGAGSARAQSDRESRYGPAPEKPPVAAGARASGFTGVGYGGRALAWSGKREIAAPEPQAQAQAQAPQPWWARSAPSAPVPPSPPQAVRPRADAPQAPAALPQSLYDEPPATSASVAQTQPRFQPGQVGARTYSVGREFGMTPDPIPAAGPSRMVLIAPPPATQPADPDKASDAAGGEWSAKPEKDSGQ
ncbi:hypothetical protein [uncultured Caulobacter sp.]|uniref:hypothetical protein n=1 Tax=uncultured Caulobacter sp. TaxID=158749 RepID=UPI00261321CF|nr:hypothetical protein [uncultured Caulobacter sp.]